MQPRRLTTVLSFAVFLPASAAFAQSTAADAPKDSAQWAIGATQLRAGSAGLGLGSLNASLAQNNRPTFSNTVPTLGISTYARRGRLLFGASLDGSWPHRSAQGDWVTKLSTGSATLDAGVVLMDASSLQVKAGASLGIRSTSLHFERRGDFTYDEGLGDPARGVDLMSHGGVAEIGLAIERRFETQTGGQFSLAIQSGVARPLGAAATFAGENHVRGTPTQTTGRYVRVVVGKPIANRRRALDTVGASLFSMLFR